MAETVDRGLLLRGIDGANLLGFLAAVGTLRTLALADSGADWRLKWMFCDGSWTPNLSSSNKLSEGGLVAVLHAELTRPDHPASRFPFDNLNVTPGVFGQVALEAQRGAMFQDRRFADFVVALGTEALANQNGNMRDTDLRALGAGRTSFLGTMKKLIDEEHSSADHLRRSLFESWNYADRRLGMRWDPEEDRRYALRWSNPSGEVPITVRGANRLAVEALPLLPTAPDPSRLRTTGVARRDGSIFLTWPTWEDPLSVDVLRSVLALRQLQDSNPDRPALRARGIVEVYRCQRISNGRYRSFTHAVPA